MMSWWYHVLSLVRLGVGVGGVIGWRVGGRGGCGVWSVVLLSEWFRGIVVLRNSGVHGVHLASPWRKLTGHSGRPLS